MIRSAGSPFFLFGQLGLVWPYSSFLRKSKQRKRNLCDTGLVATSISNKPLYVSRYTVIFLLVPTFHLLCVRILPKRTSMDVALEDDFQSPTLRLLEREHRLRHVPRSMTFCVSCCWCECLCQIVFRCLGEGWDAQRPINLYADPGYETVDEGSGGSDCPITTTPLLPFLHVDLGPQRKEFMEVGASSSLILLRFFLLCQRNEMVGFITYTRQRDWNAIESISREENVLHRLEGGTYPKLLCHPAGAVGDTTPNDGSHRASATPSLDRWWKVDNRNGSIITNGRPKLLWSDPPARSARARSRRCVGISGPADLPAVAAMKEVP